MSGSVLGGHPSARDGICGLNIWIQRHMVVVTSPLLSACPLDRCTSPHSSPPRAKYRVGVIWKRPNIVLARFGGLCFSAL